MDPRDRVIGEAVAPELAQIPGKAGVGIVAGFERVRFGTLKLNVTTRISPSGYDWS